MTSHLPADVERLINTGNIRTYLVAAMRTKSGIFKPENVDREACRDAFAAALNVGEMFKAIKKAIFADKGVYQTSPLRDKATLSGAFQNSDISPDILHAITGILNESGEIANAVITGLDGHPVDMENLDEEFGDLLWFWVLYCHGRKIDPWTIMQKNIAKLRARYPEKFDAEKLEDSNRDLAAEAAAMGSVESHNFQGLSVVSVDDVVKRDIKAMGDIAARATEKAVRDQLIAAGWTPPPGAAQ